MPLQLSRDEGLGLKEWGISVQVQLSAFNGNPPLQTGDDKLQEASHWEGDPGHSLLQSGRFQRVSLRTTVYRVAKLLILVISKFPSCPQSELVVAGTFLEKSNNKNIILLVLLFRQKKEKSQGYLSRKQELVRQEKLWEQTGFLISTRGANWCC